MTWNIHGGVGADGRHDLERVLAVIRETDPDVVALQEIDSRRSRGQEHPVAMFQRALGHHGIAAAAIATTDGDYGQALLSRYPLTHSKTHDISVPGREPRRAITAVVNAPAGNLYVLATHLGLGFAERRLQCRRLQDLTASPLTSVAMGDFNDWMFPGSVQHALANIFPGRTVHRTFPARLPLLRLDRIYCKPASALLESHTKRTGDASDHLPVIATVRI